MKKTLATGVILALITSNFIILDQYKTDMGNYQSKIDNQTKIIKQREVNVHKQSDQITSQLEEVKQLTKKNNDLQSKLNNANKEIAQLKKELQVRKVAKKKPKQKQLNMDLTFYTANCQGCSGITATGINVENTTHYKGYTVIAADPRVIKMNSIIKIETKDRTFYGYVADTGSAIKNNLLDVLVSSESEAYRLGRQKAVVTVIREGA